MNPFMHSKHKTIIIVGCGGLGSALAVTLAGRKDRVFLIDCNEESCKNLPHHFDGSFVQGDGTDPDTWKLLPVENCHLLIAATGDDNTNLMIVQIATTLYHVERVLARIDDTSKNAACSQTGIVAISSPALMCHAFEKALEQEESA